MKIRFKEFYYGGALLDVEINEKKMDTYLKKFENEYRVLSNDYLKKIKQL